MDNTITLTDSKVIEELHAGAASKSTEKGLISFYEAFSDIAAFDTGILPVQGTGLLAIRKALDHTQIVFQHQPGKYHIFWGKRERDPHAKAWFMAQPYRIVIGDLQDGNLIGARTFYSPVPINTSNQPLYHANIPNLNCKGYRGNGVGWLCLYLNESNSKWAQYSFGDKVRALLERASGAEAYNDANMSSTDGPRFYRQWYSTHKPELVKEYNFLYEPEAWQAKTEAEGYEWTLDDDLWIPIMVKGIDEQGAHSEEPGAVPLTLEMAMLGKYKSYYSDPWVDKGINKPINEIVRPDLDPPSKKKVFASIRASVNKAASVDPSANKEAAPIEEVVDKAPLIGGNAIIPAAAPVWTPKIYCSVCKKGFDEGSDEIVQIAKYGGVCTKCVDTTFDECSDCKAVTHFGDMVAYEGNSYCTACRTVYTCGNCGVEHLDFAALLDSGCIKCQQFFMCDSCDMPSEISTGMKVTAKVPGSDTPSKFSLCSNCFEDSVICACGFLRMQDTTANINGTSVCEPCIVIPEDGQLPFFNPINTSVTINTSVPDEETIKSETSLKVVLQSTEISDEELIKEKIVE